MGRAQRYNTNLTLINDRLADLFGREVVTGNPIHRVIHAKGEIEKRRISHADVFTEGGIFLREEFNVTKETLKYPYFQHCHVFEMYVPFQKLDNSDDEIITGDNAYVYECFYAFQDKDGNALPVNWKAVEIIMHFKLYGKRDKSTGKTEDLAIQEEDDKAIKYYEERLKEDSLITAPNYGVKGLFVPSNYERQRYGTGRLMDASLVQKEEQPKMVSV